METKKYKLKSGNILEVIQDELAESPDYWEDKNVFLVYNHRQFSIIRQGFQPRAIFEFLHDKENDKKAFEKEYGVNGKDCVFSDYYIFTVYATIHSGVHLSLNKGGDVWDTSSTGYILVRKFTDEEPEQNLIEDKAKEYAEGLIETWNQYLSGDIYGFQILKPIKTYTITEEKLINLIIGHDENYKKSFAKEAINIDRFIYYTDFLQATEEKIEYEEIDSCWGFYGSDPKTNGMIEHINDEIIEEI